MSNIWFWIGVFLTAAVICYYTPFPQLVKFMLGIIAIFLLIDWLRSDPPSIQESGLHPTEQGQRIDGGWTIFQDEDGFWRLTRIPGAGRARGPYDARVDSRDRNGVSLDIDTSDLPPRRDS